MRKKLTLLLCRNGFEQTLCDEMQKKNSRESIYSSGTGFVFTTAAVRPTPYIFERQRCLNAERIPLDQCNPITDQIARDVFAPLVADPMPWAYFNFTIQESAVAQSALNIDGIGKALLKKISLYCPALVNLQRKAENLIARRHGKLVQLVLTEKGLFYGCNHPDELSSPFEGGIHRMRFDNQAPSRSYLKIEEALSYLKIEPKAGERVVDLGAAPGGWSYAFAKRGCSVLAVDNGPLKLPETLPGRVIHIQADGITYVPGPREIPVDWLVADMLIAPGKTIPILKQWLYNGWTKRIVMNIKLPQHDPYEGVKAIETWVQNHKSYKFAIRQLYHDRREVTLFGTVEERQ